jgi:hypothetical protein
LSGYILAAVSDGVTVTALDGGTLEAGLADASQDANDKTKAKMTKREKTARFISALPAKVILYKIYHTPLRL